MTEDSKVSFRIPAPYAGRLEREARERGISRHQYARLLLIRELENADLLDLLDETRALRALVEELAGELRREKRPRARAGDRTKELLRRLSE